MVNDMDNSNHSDHSTEEMVVRRAVTPTTVNATPANVINGARHTHSPKVSAIHNLQSPTSTVSHATSAAAAAYIRTCSSPSIATALPTTTSIPMPRKIMSRNHNNTLFPTSFPSNLAELQLFRVMQNASLLYYYDTLLEMGGDDVQQLCDAGEEEFLEIMSLVGMASKPLHVRRFQKSLQEWVNNSTRFKSPLIPSEDFELERTSQSTMFTPTPPTSMTQTANQYSFEETARSIYAASPASPSQPYSLTANKRPYSPLDAPNSCPPSSSSSPGSCASLPGLLSNGGGNGATPALPESHVVKLCTAADRLSKQLPQFEPKPQNSKKKMCKELELVMSMPDSDPRRMDEIRKYAAIYGRFDCKRRPEKPLTLHEVSVNEAAAQICRFIPALLTRRDELFPLARQVVKDSGCHYSKTGASYTMCLRTASDLVEGNSNSNPGRTRLEDNTTITITTASTTPTSTTKRRYDESGFDEDAASPAPKRHQEYLKYDNNARSSIHFSASLLQSKAHNRICSGTDDDDADLQYSLSNSCSNSPLRESEKDIPDEVDEVKLNIDSEPAKYSPRVHVIAASGDNIIAVANPALALSPAILPSGTTFD